MTLLLLTPDLMQAQDNVTIQPDSQATLTSLPITIQPEQYKRTCNPVHALLYDSNYRAFLEKPNYRLDVDGTLSADYGASYENAGWQYVPQAISTFGLMAAYAWCESGDPVALQLAVSQ
ncbi:MAG: hypothetical protein ABI690_34050, partial [Chloroflexota bacterium]